MESSRVQTHRLKAIEAQLKLALAARFAGSPGPPGSETVASFAFTYLTPSPVNLGAIAAGSLFNRAAVLVTVPFNDPSATLSLGPSAAPTALLSPGDSLLSIADQYESSALVSSGVDFLRFTLNPAASTQGAGLVFWKVLP